MSYRIVAIVGKSASGKDYLSKKLGAYEDFNLAISDTTRPPRETEIDKVDYNFIDKQTFFRNAITNKYVSKTCFKDWYYAVNLSSLRQNRINILVLDCKGLIDLKNQSDRYNIVKVIETKCSLRTRIKRYLRRDKKCSKFELVRRTIADWYDFNIRYRKELLNTKSLEILKTDLPQNDYEQKFQEILCSILYYNKM